MAKSGLLLMLAKFPVFNVTVELVTEPSSWMMSMFRNEPSQPFSVLYR